MATSQTYLRFQLGDKLRQARDAAGLTIEQAASLIEVSHSTLSRIEAGLSGIRLPALNVLMDRYGLTDVDYRQTLAALATEGRKRGPGRGLSNLPISYRRFIGLESAAIRLDNYESIVVPGQMQTEEYARALMLAAQPDADVKLIEERVQIKMERQRQAAETGMRLSAVIDESVLHRQIGGETVMAAQVLRLLEDAADRRIDLQVLPFRGGGYAGMAGSFAIVTLPEPAPSAVYIEGLTSDLLAEDDAVRRYRLVFDSLRAAALSPRDSVTLIERIRQGAA